MFHHLFVQPIFNLLIFIYNLLPIKDLGVASIILVVLIRIILFPFFKTSFFTQRKIAEISPQIKEIQQKYKKDLKKQAEELQKLYKKHKINPFSSFILLLIQIPILVALYKVFLSGFSEEILQKELYSFVKKPEEIHTLFLGFLNLSQKNYLFALLVALVQFLQSKLTSKNTFKEKDFTSEKEKKIFEITQKVQKQMAFIMPVFTFFILSTLPSIIALYWLTTNLFSFLEYFLAKKIYERKNYLKS